MPEDDWICLDKGMEVLEGCGVMSDCERIKLSSGSSSGLLLEVVEPVVTVPAGGAGGLGGGGVVVLFIEG